MTTVQEPIVLSVGGMTCAGCASNVQRGLALIPGVEGADVNIATRRATVHPDGTLDPQQLELAMRAAITGLGYQVLTPDAGPTPDAAPTPAPNSPGHTPHTAESTLAAEHEAHLHADANRVHDYARRLVVSAVLTLPVLLISMVDAWHFAHWEWLAAALATPAIFWGGWPFHRSTWASARHGAVQMDTLVTVGTMAAWMWSMVVLLGGAAGVDALRGGHVYFETGAVIVTLLLVGKWVEVRSTSRASDAIRALGRHLAATARLEDGTEVPREALTHGMHFVVRPGEIIATDGTVVEGAAAVDASLVTGESVPVAVTVGTPVVGGTLATDGTLTVEVTRVGAETMLAQVTAMVDKALSGRARIQRLADRISAVFVPVVMGLSVLTLVAWLLLTGDAHRAFTAAVAVLIISCPCALGLATPLAILVGTGRGAQLGVLVAGPQVLEDTRTIGTIVLDKTGTLTQGRMALVGTFPADALGTPDAPDAARLARAAASVEDRSEHPVARAIAAASEARMPLKGFRSTPGQGVTATVQAAGRAGEDVDVTVGSRRLFDRVSADLEAWAAAREAEGHTVAFAGRAPAVGTGLLGGAPLSLGAVTRTPLEAEMAFAVSDQLKPTAATAVQRLRGLGLDVVLLTGDNARAAQAVAERLGIDRVHAEVLPGDKAAVVAALQAQGHRVAMVGDGVNDAPALAQADLGIALGTGTDVAREASDLTLVSGDPRAAADAIALSRRTLGTIRGNLFWAFAYNVAMIPLAALGVLNPMIASAAMGASSLFVVGNSLRLRSFRGYRA